MDKRYFKRHAARRTYFLRRGTADRHVPGDDQFGPQLRHVAHFLDHRGHIHDDAGRDAGVIVNDTINMFTFVAAVFLLLPFALDAVGGIDKLVAITSKAKPGYGVKWDIKIQSF